MFAITYVNVQIEILLDLIATSDPDPTFERPAEIPWEVTTPREAFS